MDAKAVVIGIFAGVVVALLPWATLFESGDEVSVSAAIAPSGETASVPDRVSAIRPEETTLSQPVLSPRASPLPEVAPTTRVLGMLAMALAGDKEAVLSTMATMDAFPKPMHGDAALAREKNDAGVSALRQNSYGTAIARFHEGIQADPANAEIRYNLGQALMASGRFNDAKQALIDSVTLEPARAAAWVNLGLVFVRQGEEELAAAAFIASMTVSKPGDDAIGYFTALSHTNEDPAVRMAAAKALESDALKDDGARGPHTKNSL